MTTPTMEALCPKCASESGYSSEDVAAAAPLAFVGSCLACGVGQVVADFERRTPP